MIINVTSRDINLAKQLRRKNKDCYKSYESCPIALAIKRTQRKKVAVDCGGSIDIDGIRYIGKTEKEEDRINNFIERFDNKKAVSVSEFEIDRITNH